MVPHERRKSRDVLVADLMAVGAELGDGGVHVPGVEEDPGVEDETEGADLVLHAVLVALVELPGTAVEDLPGERVPAFLKVGLHLGLAAVTGLVGQTQDVQGLRDPTVVRDRVPERGRAPVAGEHPNHVVRADGAGVDGADDPQDVLPVPLDPGAARPRAAS
ncbi:hypothetical protein ACVW0K_000251 [Streptomyces filamentosus]